VAIGNLIVVQGNVEILIGDELQTLQTNQSIYVPFG